MYTISFSDRTTDIGYIKVELQRRQNCRSFTALIEFKYLPNEIGLNFYGIVYQIFFLRFHFSYEGRSCGRKCRP